MKRTRKEVYFMFEIFCIIAVLVILKEAYDDAMKK